MYHSIVSRTGNRISTIHQTINQSFNTLISYHIQQSCKQQLHFQTIKYHASPHRSFSRRRMPIAHDAPLQPNVNTINSNNNNNNSSTPTSPFPSASSLLVSDILQRYNSEGRTYTISDSSSLVSASVSMIHHGIGCLVCVNEIDQVTGLITERDVLQAITMQQDWKIIKVAEMMTEAREMICVAPSDRSDQCLELMTTQGFRHLPVLDGTKLKGLISMRNLVDMMYKGNRGGKAKYLQDILPRIGLPLNTSLFHSQSSQLRYSLISAVSSIPHPHKKDKGGEDTYIMTEGITLEDGQIQKVHVLGVFDGVGSWSFEQGIDASLFSKKLCEGVQIAVEQHRIAAQTIPTTSPLTPLSLLESAWEFLKSSSQPGGSTACVVTLSECHYQLKIANLGDSGFLLLRPNSSNKTQYDIVYRSSQQLHYFNCPFQLGISLEGAIDQYDPPESADTMLCNVQQDDLIVLATDGLFDNLTEETIVALLSKHLLSNSTSPSSSLLSSATTLLTSSAFDCSIDKRVDGPFALLAKDNNIMWSGGRRDDITVILAKVNTNQQPKQQTTHTETEHQQTN